jgi:TolA-binding protein
MALALAVAAVTAPAAAQESAEARVRRLEAEVRALQRQVFPGGSGRFFGPDSGPSAAGPGTPLSPSSGAVTDLRARIDSIEAQLSRLTAQIEETGNLARGLQARLATLENAGIALAAPEKAVQPAPTGQSGLLPSGPTPARAQSAATGALVPGAVPTDRTAALRSITRPDTGDPGDDAYTYGFRLWQAGLFPEAAKQLQATLDQYPRHKRVSYTRNLLGRAYLDDGKPGTAAQVFLQNYQADRTGARAPDSLLYLAIAMTRLNETGRACVALQELSEGFPAEVAGRLGREYQAARAAVTCDR